MNGATGGRVQYRVRQFISALRANSSPLSEAEASEAQAHLPEEAWRLFRAMPRQDQRHSLEVLHTLRATGDVPPALAQAALLHDCAKHRGGIRLWHRVAVVLIKAFDPESMDRWRVMGAPAPSNWRYPFWAHLHHAEDGARLAAEAGCDPLAVALIRQHGGRAAAGTLDLPDPPDRRLLADLQAADDDN
jgi:hypothetical protein